MNTLTQFSISSPDVQTMEFARFLTCLALIICACIFTFLLMKWQEKRKRKSRSFTDWHTNFKEKYPATPLPGQSALAA
jgi:hypothetical protein